jgi:exosortase
MSHSRNSIGKWALPAVIVLYWLQLFNQLRYDWTSNPEYAYGWFVPLLAAVIFWQRWKIRPAPNAPLPNPSRDRLVLCVALGLVVLILPIRISSEANIGWRAMFWLHAFVVAGLTCVALWVSGGKSWLRHFFFPVAFLLVAVPWPRVPEGIIVSHLMRVVAAATVDVVAFLGIPAIQHGATLQISTGMLGVDEACSGVRSMHLGIMIGLFLGECYLLSPWRRLWGVVFAIVLALVANVGRTSFLTWMAARFGFGTMNAWHDCAGLMVLVFIMGTIWPSVSLLRTKDGIESHLANHRNPAVMPDVAIRLLPLPLLVVLGLFVPASEALNEAWYQLQDHNLIKNPAWTLCWPTNAVSFQEEPIAPRSLDILHCDHSDGAGWTDENGSVWHGAYLQWEPNNMETYESTEHLPEICLSNAGWKLVQKFPSKTIRVNGIDLSFLRYIFEIDGNTAYVFVCLWQDRHNANHTVQTERADSLNRFQTAFYGERRLERKKIEFALYGPNSAEEAFDQLKQQLQQIIKPTSSSNFN